MLEVQVVRPHVDARDERAPAREPEGRPPPEEQDEPDQPEDREHRRRPRGHQLRQIAHRRGERAEARGREQAAELAAELFAGDEEPQAVERGRVVVGQRRVGGGRDRDVRVHGEPGEPGDDGCEEPGGLLAQRVAAGPQREQDEERGDEPGQQVVAQAEAHEQPAQGEVAQPVLVGPDEGAVDEQRHQREVERVDLGHDRGRPDRDHGPGRQRRQRREHRAHADPRPDRRQRPERDRDAHRRQQVRAPGDRAQRDQLEQPRESGCRSGSRWDGRPRGRGARSASRPSRRTPPRASA